MASHAIIGGDIHKLVRIAKNEDWTYYAWRIHEDSHWYWVPIEDQKRNNPVDKWKLDSNDKVCIRTKRKW